MVDADAPSAEQPDRQAPRLHQPIRCSEQRGALAGRQCELCEAEATTQSADLILCDHQAELARRLVTEKREGIVAHLLHSDVESPGDTR